MPRHDPRIQPSPGGSRLPDLRRHAGLALISALAVALTVAMVAYPDLAFASAVKGLKVWWDVVFPALLPFFIAGQVLMALGVVSFMGVLMEPYINTMASSAQAYPRRGLGRL